MTKIIAIYARKILKKVFSKIDEFQKIYKCYFKNNRIYEKIDPVFSLFPKQNVLNDKIFYYNFIGGKVRKEYFKREWGVSDSERIGQPHWNACLWTNKDPRYACSEDYYEWLDLLTAIANAKDSFNFLKLGAFVGRWEAFAAIANHSYERLKCKLVSVECDPDHIERIIQTFEDNNIIDFPEVEHEIVLLSVGKENKNENNTISLNTLIDKFEVVDLIDSDIQGAESEVFNSSAAYLLNKKVKRVHIGTHGKEIDMQFKKFFTDIGWQNINLFGWYEKVILPQGKMVFQDGIQTWVNPRFHNNDTSDIRTS